MLGAYATAVLALLEADANLNVYDGAVPDQTPAPYVVVYINTDSERSERLTSNTSAGRVRITTHSVADTAQGARIVADRVRSALLDVRPVVAGVSTHPIRHEFGIPPVRDESTGYLVMDVVDGWTSYAQREA